MTDEFLVEFDSAPYKAGEFQFNYKNSNDVGVTYNEDGTINVYIQTDFATEDERLYYQISLGDMRFRSRDALFVAEGLPFASYGLVYDVCYEENGIQYSVFNVSVSGSVNEIYADGYIYVTTEENSITLSVGDYQMHMVDLNSIRLVSSNGEEIQLTQEDFVYNEGYGEYLCTVNFAQGYEFITLYATYIPFAESMEGIPDYVGSTSVSFERIIYTY